MYDTSDMKWLTDAGDTVVGEDSSVLTGAVIGAACVDTAAGVAALVEERADALVHIWAHTGHMSVIPQI